MNIKFKYNMYLLLYFLWEIDNATQRVINVIGMPIVFFIHYFLKLFGQKITWKERLSQIDQSLYDPQKGVSIIFSRNTLGGLVGLLLGSVFNFIQALSGVMLYGVIFENIAFFVLFIVLFGYVGYKLNCMLIDDEKVPSYFKRFNKEFKGNRWKYRTKCIIIIISILAVVVCSFIAMANSCFK